MRVLAIVECMIELAARQDARDRSFAGDTFDTLWMMKGCLGESLEGDFFTGFGSEPFSQQQIAFMQSGRIGISSSRTDLSSPPGIFGITLAENGERSFTYWRETSAARKLADDPAALAAACRERDLIYFSGITLAILDANGRKTLLDAVSEARKKAARVASDPNYRPCLWHNRDDARAVIIEGLRHADIALPTHDEKLALFGDPTPSATLLRLSDLGVPEVIVKNGAAGCLIGGQELPESLHVSACQGMPVLDTTGAGDAFNGAYLAGRIDGLGCAGSAEIGHALAAETVGVKGALLPLKRLVPRWSRAGTSLSEPTHADSQHKRQ